MKWLLSFLADLLGRIFKTIYADQNKSDTGQVLDTSARHDDAVDVIDRMRASGGLAGPGGGSGDPGNGREGKGRS